MAHWATGRVGLDFKDRGLTRRDERVLHPPGQPWHNVYVESVNSRVRDECLKINSFWSPPHHPGRDHRLVGRLQPL